VPAGSELNERLGRARKHETYRVRSEVGFGEGRFWTPDEAHEHHWRKWIEGQRIANGTTGGAAGGIAASVWEFCALRHNEKS